MELSQKQRAFIDQYLIDANGSKAAIRAGYSPNGARQTAYRLLTNNDVRAEIARKQKDSALKLQIDRETVLRGILQAIANAKFTGNPMAAIRGWGEINKMMGFYESENSEISFHSHKSPIEDRIRNMPTADLLALTTGD